MHPAWSVILFTTITGAAQGLVLLLAGATLLGLAPAPGLLSAALLGALAMLLSGLCASFLHLGRPLRAWRAVAMWRTSWLSREVIVLPAFIGVVALWWWSLQRGGPMAAVLPVLAMVLALALWWCTAMIYACLRFIQEWAHPLTLATFVSTGMASGALLAAALSVVGGEAGWARAMVPPAAVLTLLAWALRAAALRRNRRLRPVSTLQSATGIRGAPLVQKSMGMSAGSFNTREFFHGASAAAVRHVRHALHGLCFAAPLALLAAVGAGGPVVLLPVALLLHVPGLLAERWLFFAQARHTQNLYYQQVS